MIKKGSSREIDKKEKRLKKKKKSRNSKVSERKNRPKLGSAFGLHLIEDEQQSEVVYASRMRVLLC